MTISRAEFEDRTRRRREKMKAEELDALIVFSDAGPSGNQTHYLTGYKPLNMIEESPQSSLFWTRTRRPSSSSDVSTPMQRRILFGPTTSGRSIVPRSSFPTSAGRSGHPDFAHRPDRRQSPACYESLKIIKKSLPKATFTSVTPLLIQLRQIKTSAEVSPSWSGRPTSTMPCCG